MKSEQAKGGARALRLAKVMKRFPHLGSGRGSTSSARARSRSLVEKFLIDSLRDKALRVYQLVLLCLLLLLFLSNYSSREGLSGLFWWRLVVSGLVVGVFFLFLRHLRYFQNRIREREMRLDDLRAENRQLQAQLARLEPQKEQERIEGEIDKRLKELNKRLVGNTISILTNSFFTILSQDWQLVQSILFLYDASHDDYRSESTYAFFSETEGPKPFRVGETLTGQVVLERKPLLLQDLPSDYRIVTSGLGRRAPRFLLIVPLGEREERIQSEHGEARVRRVAQGAIECAFFVTHTEMETELLQRFINDYWGRLAHLRGQEKTVGDTGTEASRAAGEEGI